MHISSYMYGHVRVKLESGDNKTFVCIVSNVISMQSTYNGYLYSDNQLDFECMWKGVSHSYGFVFNAKSGSRVM